MRQPLVIALSVALICFSATTPGQESKPDRATSKVDVKKATNEELIDQLVKVSDPTALGSGFIAVDGELEFEGGILGSVRPSGDPAIKELVRRGVESLPDLISHLADDRKTGLSIEEFGFAFGAKWHSDEYHSRFRDKKRLPKDVNTGKEVDLDEPYTLRVGDLCYVTIGQIVNRGLCAVRYQPTGCYVINSPVVTPKLAEAVKGEWAGLTAEDHERSLIADAETPFWGGPPPALERLVFYYPKSAEKVAASLLARELYNYDVVWHFMRNDLVKHMGEDDWRAIVAKFRDLHGQNVADSIPYSLHSYYGETEFELDKAFLRESKIAGQILDKVFPDFDPENPAVFNAAELNDQIDIVAAVRHLSSNRIDSAVHSLYLSAIDKRAELQIDARRIDRLALLAIQREGDGERRREYKTYFADRLSQLKKELAQIADNKEFSRKEKAEEIREVEELIKSIKE